MSKKKLENFIDKMIRTKKKFPYMSYDKEHVLSEVEKLSNYDSSDIISKRSKSSFANNFKYSGKRLFTINSVRTGNIISDYFFQNIRMKASMYPHQSPINVWKDVDKRRRLFRGMVTLNKGKYEYSEPQLRSSMRLYFSVVPQFKVSVAKCIFDTFKPSIVLDFSAGWGDRLVGFYCSEYTHKYIGIDPNEDLKQPYTKMCNLLNSIIHNKSVKMYYKPAEKTRIKCLVDLIFTSPPYFNLEHYSNTIGQSDISYDSLESWLENFLFKCLTIHLKCLKISGRLILQLSDYKFKGTKVKIIEPLKQYMLERPDFIFEGIILVKTKGRHSAFITEPLFVWKRIKKH